MSTPVLAGGALADLRVADGVATLLLDDPDTRNELGRELFERALELVRAVHDREDVRVLVLTGAGDAFTAGGAMQRLVEEAATPQVLLHDTRRLTRLAGELVLAVRDLRCVTIAAIDGFAVGAGVGLALACDLRIASDRASVLLGYSRLGGVPDAGVSWTLPRLVGEARALELLLEDRPLKGDRLLASGLVHDLVPHEDLDAEVARRAARYARRLPPQYVAAVKAHLVRTRTGSLAEQIAAENDRFATAALSADFAAGMAAYVDGRNPPRFTGR